MTTREEVYREVEQKLGMVPDWIQKMPDGMAAGFWHQARDFWLAETKLSPKTKELIGIAVAGATRCRYCALFHTEAARMFGATDEEIAEAAAMASFTMEGSTFINAEQIDFEEFQREVRSIVEFVQGQQAAQQGARAAASGAQQAEVH